ncbi:MAG: hypothetical protein RR687_08310 [Comamonas sp.]
MPIAFPKMRPAQQALGVEQANAMRQPFAETGLQLPKKGFLKSVDKPYRLAGGRASERGYVL